MIVVVKLIEKHDHKYEIDSYSGGSFEKLIFIAYKKIDSYEIDS